MSENIAPTRAVPLSEANEPAQQEIRNLREALIRKGCIAVALLVPLKLSLTYLALIPLIVLWGLTDGRSFKLENLSLNHKRVIVPVLFFLSSVALSSLFGINPLRSFNLLLSLFFFSATLMVFSRYGEPVPVITALLAGQAISASHSVFDAAFPDTITGFFVGKVTESGQLALTLLVSLGLLWHVHPQASEILRAGDRRRLFVGGLLATVALTSFGFMAQIQIPPLATICLFACVIILLLPALTRAVKEGGTVRRYALLLAIQSPLLLAALMVNLKRGPWLGVTVGSTVFFAIFAPRLAAIVLSLSAVAAVTIAPITERLAASYQHFTIVGGRSTIWRIGMELIAQFPLGVGFHNSDTLRRFAPEIPPELRHFHNNVLNITAENGWLTGALFLWLVAAMLRCSFARPLNALHVGIGCAIISWQTAGLVEYNVGDSEVMLIVWILMGVLLYDQRSPAPHL